METQKTNIKTACNEHTERMERGAVTEVLRVMEPGDAVDFPLIRLRSVKTIASECGLMWGRRFRTNARRKEGIVRVTRTE